MTTLNNNSRRKFLMNLARTGALLPFAGQLIGTNAFAQTAGAKRVLFLYYPNGVVPYTWRPTQDSGAITNGTELSFGLGPLKDYHNKMIVLKNCTLDIGPGAGAHKNDMRGILTGNNEISNGSASIDHLIAEKLGNLGVLNLGVRNGTDSSMMISKARNRSTMDRDLPNNDPKVVSQNLASRVGGGGITDLQRRMYETILTDFDNLASASLDSVRKSKIDEHAAALRNLKDQAGVGACGFTTTTVTDSSYLSTGQLTQTEWQLFPSLCRAQVDNIVGAFSCGLHKVATLQLSKGDENGNLVNYSYDECWAMSQLAVTQGIRATEGGGIVSNPTRWYNEHSSHSASHSPGNAPHSAQVRWYHSLLAYTLQQLNAKGILDDTLVVMTSEVGDGSQHGGAAGSVIVAGGAGGTLQMGRVIKCGDGMNNGQRTFGTHQLFGDVARYLGATGLQESYWTGGVI